MQTCTVNEKYLVDNFSILLFDIFLLSPLEKCYYAEYGSFIENCVNIERKLHMCSNSSTIISPIIRFPYKLKRKSCGHLSVCFSLSISLVFLAKTCHFQSPFQTLKKCYLRKYFFLFYDTTCTVHMFIIWPPAHYQM